MTRNEFPYTCVRCILSGITNCCMPAHHLLARKKIQFYVPVNMKYQVIYYE